MPSSTNRKSFVGSGVAFPFEFSLSLGGGTRVKTSLSISAGIERIRQSLLQILYTRIGERVMRRRFGSQAFNYLFEVLDPLVIEGMNISVSEAVSKLEPRIRVSRLNTSLIDKAAGLLQIDLNFEIIDQNVTGNLVFPFYVGTGNSNPAMDSDAVFGLKNRI